VLEADVALDKVDRYGRLLRYIRRNGSNINLELVRRGAATPYFYGGDRGRYASRLMAAARAARAAKRGLWRACPGTRLDPYAAAATGKRRGRVSGESTAAERSCRRAREGRRAGLEGAKRRSAAIGSASSA
jgi:endonuclease YncB( thermonuclease family)